MPCTFSTIWAMAQNLKTSFISINLKISFITSVIPIVLYSVWLLKSAPQNAPRDLQVDVEFPASVLDKLKFMYKDFIVLKLTNEGKIKQPKLFK